MEYDRDFKLPTTPSFFPAYQADNVYDDNKEATKDRLYVCLQ